MSSDHNEAAPPWADVLGELDRAVFRAAGWGRTAGFGDRPAVLVVDANYNFCGDRPEPILTSIERWRFSCGEVAWNVGIPAIERILSAARARRLPVVYTTSPRRADGFDLGVWKDKSSRSDEPVDVVGHRGNEIVDEIRPAPGDIFVEKRKPSAFFGTPLVSYLMSLRADSLIVVGSTTSGCVRASAIDAISYDLRVVIPHEAVFDRSVLSHKVSLMDLHMKYADVVTTSAVTEYIEGLETGLFDAVFPPYATYAGARPRSPGSSEGATDERADLHPHSGAGGGRGWY